MIERNLLVRPRGMWICFSMLLLVCVSVTSVQAQLNAGDLLILGINPNNDACLVTPTGAHDVIILATLVDLPPSTSFMITDNGYQRNSACDGSWGNTEGVLKFTTPSTTTVPAGTVFRMAIKTSNQAYTQLNHTTTYPLSYTSVGTFNITGAEGSEDQISIIEGDTWNNGTLGNNNATAGGFVLFTINNDAAWSSCGTGSPEFDSDLDGDYCYKVTHFETLLGDQRFLIYNGPTTPTTRFGWVVRAFTPVCNWEGEGNCTDWNNQPIASLNSITVTPLTDALTCTSNCSNCTPAAPTLQINLPTIQTCNVTLLPTAVYYRVYLSNGQNFNNLSGGVSTLTLNTLSATTNIQITQVRVYYTIANIPSYYCAYTNYPGAELIVVSGAISPTANAGANQTLCSPQTANIAGIVGGTGVTTGTWSVVSGGTGIFGNANALSTNFTPNAPGTYTLQLTTNDPDGSGPCVAATDQVVLVFGDEPVFQSGQRCGDGSVTLSVTGCVGAISWYDNDAGGTPIATGNTYTTPSISATTVYYAQCITGSCASSIYPVLAIVHPKPENAILTASDTVICPNQTVTFTASLPPFQTGTYKYQFFKNGVSLGPASLNNTTTQTGLLNGDQITVKTYKTITYNGIISPYFNNNDTRFWPAVTELNISDKNPTEPVGNSLGVQHRVNAVMITGIDDSIYMMVAGRVSNLYKILVFFDSKSGGYNVANYGRLNADPAVANFNDSTNFDAGFFSDYVLSIGTNAGETNYFIDLYTLSGTSTNVTSGGPIVVSMNNNNVAHPFGVNESSTIPNDFNYGNGFEFAFKKSDIGYTGGDLNIFTAYVADDGFVSNQFVSPANLGVGNYGYGPISFQTQSPNPIFVPDALLNDDCEGISQAVTMVVANLPVPTITPSNPVLTCQNSTINLTVTGTYANYNWNVGADLQINPITVAGTYTVTISDSGNCTNSASIVVTSTIGPLPAPTFTNDSSCITSQAINVSGCPGGTITWYPNATGGPVITTGASYNPGASSNTTLYVQCAIGSCLSPFTPVTWYVFPPLAPPTFASSAGTQSCEDELVSYTVTTPTGSIYVYEFFVNGVSQGVPNSNGTFLYTPNDGDSITVKVYYNFD